MTKARSKQRQFGRAREARGAEGALESLLAEGCLWNGAGCVCVMMGCVCAMRRQIIDMLSRVQHIVDEKIIFALELRTVALDLRELLAQLWPGGK
jgi:hypothetical protein